MCGFWRLWRWGRTRLNEMSSMDLFNVIGKVLRSLRMEQLESPQDLIEVLVYLGRGKICDDLFELKTVLSCPYVSALAREPVGASGPIIDANELQTGRAATFFLTTTSIMFFIVALCCGHK